MYIIDQHSNLQQSVTEKEYRELVAASVDATLFNDWPWLVLSCRHSTAGDFCFITCRTQGDNRLIAFMGLALFQEKLYGLPVVAARFPQYPQGDRIGMLIHPDHSDAWEDILAFIFAGKKRAWNIMIWDEWVDSAGLRQRAEAFAAKHHRGLLIKKSSSCPVVTIEGRSREEFSALLPKKRRINLRRWKKKLNELPHTIVLTRVIPEEVDRLVGEVAEVEAASWKAGQDVGLFGNEKSRAFFLEAAAALARENQLFVSLVYIHEKPASYRFGFIFRNIYLDYSIGYLPEYRPLGLGSILLEEVLWEGSRRNLRAFDASRVGLRSTNPIFEWATHQVDHYRAYWFEKTIMGKLIQFLICTAKPFARKYFRKNDGKAAESS